MKNYVMYDLLGENILFSDVGLDDKTPWEDLLLYSFNGERVEIHFLITREGKPVLFFGNDPAFKGYLLEKNVKQKNHKIKTFKNKKTSINQRAYTLGTDQESELFIEFRWGEGDQDVKASLQVKKGPGIELTGKYGVPGWRSFLGDLKDLYEIKLIQVWTKEENGDQQPEEVIEYLKSKETDVYARENDTLFRVIGLIVILVILYLIFG